jgi:UDP-2,3-diacylglucosamine pyrophosphatase LpxH
LHDSLYEEGNKSYYMPYNHDFKIKSNLIHILHQADFMSSIIESQINKI